MLVNYYTFTLPMVTDVISKSNINLPQVDHFPGSLVCGLSHGVVCVILRLAVLIQQRHVTRTHRQTMMAITGASLAPHG